MKFWFVLLLTISLLVKMSGIHHYSLTEIMVRNDGVPQEDIDRYLAVVQNNG
jgi:hypothetical protein